MTTPKAQNAGKFEYNKAGHCTNPETILQHEGEQIKYTLMVSQCNTGWLIGYRLQGISDITEEFCKIAGGVHFNRVVAVRECCEAVWKWFYKDPDVKYISTDIDPLFKFVLKSGSEIITAKNRPRTTAKAGNAALITHDFKAKPPSAGTNGGDAKVDIIEINVAQIKDGMCNYQYTIIEGSQPNFKHKVDGPGLYDESLANAFEKLHVHLAAIDDAFKLSDTPIKNIDKMHSHEITMSYHVTAFKMKGAEEDPAVVLIGSKHLSSGGRMELVTPKKDISKLSSYKYSQQLKDVLDECCREVTEYHQGKYTIPDDTEDMDNTEATQLDITHEEEDRT